LRQQSGNASLAPMKKRPIDWKQASVAATFYEPVYQRLRLWHEGQMVHLLCFVKETNDQVQKLLSDCGAAPSKTLRASCFAEVWELPDAALMSGEYRHLPARLDQAVSDAFGCHGKGLTSASSLVRWTESEELDLPRRHYPSRLLREATGRSR
jgi:hypothetical protein